MNGTVSALDLASAHRSFGHFDGLWPYALALAIFFLVRGLYLRRPLVRSHIIAAVALLIIARLAYDGDRGVIGFVALALAGAALVMPKASRPTPEDRQRVFALVDQTKNDALAPFVMHSAKSFFFNAEGTATLGYRARLGIAAVAGDPVGDAYDFPALIEEFIAFTQENGWRIAVLAASESCVPLWQRHHLRAIPIGRDVVIDIESFTLTGRRFRNLRQGVQRTRNVGVTTEVIAEAELDRETRAELMAIVDVAHGGHQNRGFSMILDHLLDGRHPGVLIAMARDNHGTAVAFHRYASADGGRMLTLDVPWRLPEAPNGVDERLSVDMVAYGREHGGEKVSLAFAAFPEIFDDNDRTLGRKLVYRATHFLDPLIKIESLYRFVRKFHALDGQRFAVIKLRQIGWVLFAFLLLEFVPHRHRE
ncbi:MAG: phosphatidylglycerol lysyltransferase domain-containing protein [Mycobacteriaceae bacterium]